MARGKHPEETIELIKDTAMRLFVFNGYEHTTMQDIMTETGLSKGAIYHHFASKEDIFEAIGTQIGERNAIALSAIRDDETLSGLERLRRMFRSALRWMGESHMPALAPGLLENPKFLAMQVRDLYQTIVPDYMEPILRRGIADGSIQIDHPRQFAEAMMFLVNFWLNPLVGDCDSQELRKRCLVFADLMNRMGIELMDDEMVDEYVQICSGC